MIGSRNATSIDSMLRLVCSRLRSTIVTESLTVQPRLVVSAIYVLLLPLCRGLGEAQKDVVQGGAVDGDPGGLEPRRAELGKRGVDVVTAGVTVDAEHEEVRIGVDDVVA